VQGGKYMVCILPFSLKYIAVGKKHYLKVQVLVNKDV
jgi:hypothetical protein